MNRLFAGTLAAALVAMPASPAYAGWKLIDKNQAVVVAKSSLEVTPDEDWNRWTGRPIKKSEVWTIDGPSLNELYFVAGLAPGETLYRDVAKKDRPLPKLGTNLQLTDIPEFVESSTRIALGTSVFEITNVEPATLGGHGAVRFSYEYAIEGSPLRRNGVAIGTVVDGNLNLISFVAPSIFYFERDMPRVEAIFASAQF